MSKLDDFGRTIYETAEEYNQARRAREKNSTYDSPEGEAYQHNPIKGMSRYKSVAQRHATVQGSKKAMKKVVAIVGLILSINIGAIVSLLGNFVENRPGDYFEEEVQVYDEYLSDGEAPLPEDFDLFSYNGEFYRIPTDYWKISQMGFELEEYAEGDSFPAGYEEMLDLYDEDGYMRAMIRINNYTETELPLEECMVDYIYIENPVIFDDAEVLPDFVFGDGLTFESSYEEVEAYLGTPYYHYADHSEEGYYYDQYQWSYYKEADWMTNEPDEIHFMQITFYNDVIESVSIEKKVYEEK